MTPHDAFSTLAESGIEWTPNIKLIGSLALVKPIIIKSKCRFFGYNFFDSYSYLDLRSSFRHMHVGRYSTIGKDVQGILGKHPINGFSSSQAFLPFHFQGWPCFDLKLNFNPFPYSVHIGHDVTIKNGVSFRKSVQVGHGAIIEEHSVISKDIPPYSIVGKNNQIIGQRFNDELIADLLASEWWNYDIPAIQHTFLQKGIKVPLINPRDFIQFLADQDPSSLPLLSSKGLLIKCNANDWSISDLQPKDIK